MTFAPILIQLLAQRSQRPLSNRLRNRQRAEEVPEVVGQRMQLEADGVRVERATRQPRPLDRALTFLYPLLARPTLIIKADDILRLASQVRDDEAEYDRVDVASQTDRSKTGEIGERCEVFRPCQQFVSNRPTGSATRPSLLLLCRR
jgi:hypothetical protein